MEIFFSFFSFFIFFLTLEHQLCFKNTTSAICFLILIMQNKNCLFISKKKNVCSDYFR